MGGVWGRVDVVRGRKPRGRDALGHVPAPAAPLDSCLRRNDAKGGAGMTREWEGRNDAGGDGK